MLPCAALTRVAFSAKYPLGTLMLPPALVYARALVAALPMQPPLPLLLQALLNAAVSAVCAAGVKCNVKPSCDPKTTALAAVLEVNAATPPAMLEPLTLNVPALTTRAMVAFASSGMLIDTAELLMIVWLPGYLVKTSATVSPLLHALKTEAQPRIANQFLFISDTLSSKPRLHVKARVELDESRVKSSTAQRAQRRKHSAEC